MTTNKKCFLGIFHQNKPSETAVLTLRQLLLLRAMPYLHGTVQSSPVTPPTANQCSNVLLPIFAMH